MLLNIAPDPGHEARLVTAIALAKSRRGHINCLQALIQPIGTGQPESAVVLPEAMEAVEEAARAFREEVEIRLEQAGVAWTWLKLYGDASPLIVDHSRLADIVVLSAEGSYPGVGSVALHSRAPILAARDSRAAFDPRSPVVVAWNGSPSAAQALRASVPLLRDSGGVHILAVDLESDDFQASDALEYLAHRDVRAEAHWRQSEGRPVERVILEFAEFMGAGALVAGAFGHNRLREMLLGSVTRAMLKDGRLPLLLAH